MINENTAPTVLFDFRKDRITITRRTLSCIGEPEYILFLIHPEERRLVIVPNDGTGKMAQRIPPNRQRIEFYSKELLDKLLTLRSDWRNKQSYKIAGEAVKDGTAMVFHIDKAVVTQGA